MIYPTPQFCTIFNPLKEIGTYRYKVAYGGRAGMKTEHYASALLEIASKCKCRILCTREVQNSIEESVYLTLKDQIEKYGLNFTVTKKSITHNKTGSEFLFKGLLRQTIMSIKSMAKIDICWIEEAHSVSQRSLDILIPTIRQMNSEIWITFNPDRDDDPIYEMCVTNKLENAWILNVNYEQNPWFDDLPIKQEMETMKLANYSKYLNIWGGLPITNYDTLIFRFDQKINCVTYDTPWIEGFETWTGWDFGTADDTAILFFQIIEHYPCDEFPMGVEIRVFDEYVNNNQKASHYRDVVDNKRYLIDAHACDPSGKNRDADLSSWIDKLKKNPKNGRTDYHFQYTHKYSPAEEIDATNDLMHCVRYNSQKVPHFHKMLRRWQYRTDKDDVKILPLKPNHDEYSHVGTAFYYFIINRFPPVKKRGVENRK